MKELLQEIRALISELRARKAVAPASRLSIITIPMDTADKEYRHELPAGCKKFTIQTRDGSAFRAATQQDMVLSSSNKDYFTVDGGTWSEDNLDLQEEQRLYFASSAASASAIKYLEIMLWM